MTQIIETFYKAFSELDAETMVSCYDDNIIFEDPAFGVLKNEHAKNMWRMLCESQKGKTFIVTYSNIEANETTGSALWEAHYNFSKTGKKVHNKIKAQFEFSNGKIIKHTDDFSLHRWAKQAFGLKGYLFGGTSFFKKKLQAETKYLLQKYEQYK